MDIRTFVNFINQAFPWLFCAGGSYLCWEMMRYRKPTHDRSTCDDEGISDGDGEPGGQATEMNRGSRPDE